MARQGIGRFRSFDFAGEEPLADFFRRQRRRIRLLDYTPAAPHAEAEWTLTIRGSNPAQVPLPGTPSAITKERA